MLQTYPEANCNYFLRLYLIIAVFSYQVISLGFKNISFMSCSYMIVDYYLSCNWTYTEYVNM